MDNSSNTVTVYFPTYHPEYKINNRMDFVKDGNINVVFAEYIAKMENGYFISFQSQHIDSALEKIK